MTEAEWLAATDPAAMLEFVRDTASDRKLRLFACACCYRVSHVNTHHAARPAVEAAERFADGSITDEERRAAWRNINAKQYGDLTTWSAAFGAVQKRAYPAARHASSRAGYDIAHGILGDDWSRARKAEKRVQTMLLRDIMGNPFQPATADPVWLTSTVVALAAGVYDERVFDRMPILADALMDAECDNDDILNHCRSPRPHVRGCWVIDLLLGKT